MRGYGCWGLRKWVPLLGGLPSQLMVHSFGKDLPYTKRNGHVEDLRRGLAEEVSVKARWSQTLPVKTLVFC
jgi:hypothetical protein